jgi:hypothetical protein
MQQKCKEILDLLSKQFLNSGESLQAKSLSNWEDFELESHQLEDEEISEKFNRDEANVAYAKSKEVPKDGTPAATLSDSLVAKIEADILSGLERNIRQRYAMPRLRHFAHEISRRKSLGSDYGVINHDIANWVESLKAMGKS